MRTAFTQKLTLAALLCALLCVCSQIQIPLPPIPVSLSLLAVHITGALLGASWSAAAVSCYVLLGAVGVPVFAGFGGGLSVLFGPTGGFLFGYIASAAVTGALVRRSGFTKKNLMLSMVAGTLACYLPGTLWFMFLSHTTLAAALAACALPFLPGDLLKILFAALLTLRLQKPLRSMGL